MTPRWWLLVLLLLGVIIAPFLIWGEFDQIGFVGVKAWLENQGRWAWLAGIGLLCADILLPIPGTIVMSCMGYLYGSLLGGVIAAAGSMLSAYIAYFACRAAGRPAALWVAGEEALGKGEQWFRSESAGWTVALSRWMPVLPEAIACLAGLAKMPLRKFSFSLACGAVPMGFAFAAIGDLGREDSRSALILSAVAPVLLYGAAAWYLRQRKSKT